MKSPVKILLVAAGLFGLIGSVMGAHMAGSGSYALRPIHAHILVVGWLSLFSWSVFYQVFNVKYNGLAKFHVWTAIIGTTGLVLGMFVNNVASLGLPEVFSLILYIGGGVTLLLSFITFFVQTLLYQSK
ncbi:hypothetical protein LNK15_04885 [Jeotgalicoccus huakuii]|uniref:hypothetical protein n=1 Tax=Jeotgalicoccus TaxID=227979 RepID=UPI00040061C1|nr:MULTISPECIES: hypothetical protein [Jeotgalicoccus]MCK1976387.1 hypothetical protein [Jeotgalicoccus huakuii]QQD84433.1 hypothetical protein JEM45_07255 [Jeotgalicoccus sp. ATCC 8456]